MVQTEEVKEMLLKGREEELDVEIVPYSTKGDRVLDVALSKIGDKGLFTQELEDALLSGEIHMAVHSLKDMPTRLPEGLVLGAISRRQATLDAVVFAPQHRGSARSLSDLPAGSVVGTSSLRRTAQLRHAHGEHLQFRSVRGNVQTRLAKLDAHAEHGYDAIILAEAGLRRLALHTRVHCLLDPSLCLPAVGQGALAVEVSAACEPWVLQLLRQHIDHPPTAACCLAERAFLRSLEGGCQVPIGCHSLLSQDGLLLTLAGVVASEDGSECFRASVSGPPDEALGIQLADELRRLGCERVLINRH